jgi:hypothetical protein
MSRRIEDIDVRLEAKRRQALKLGEIREALVRAGFDTTAKQAAVLGISRPTAWVVLNRDKRAGPSAKVLKRILSSPNLPPAARRKIEEYIEEKISGLYGHEKGRTRWFRDQFITIEALPVSRQTAIATNEYGRLIVTIVAVVWMSEQSD